MGILADLLLLQAVLLVVAGVELVGDKTDLAPPCRIRDKLLGYRIDFDPLGAQLGRAPGPRDQRGHDYRADKERGDMNAFGALNDVHNRSIDEYHRDQATADCRAALALSPGRERDGYRC